MTERPTPKDTIFRDGCARLYRFRPSPSAEGGTKERDEVVLLVPSLINRWYILDLREGASVAGAFVEAGFRTYCLDWGVPQDEDRYLSWELVLQRLHRMVRRVLRHSGATRIGLLGYCMGATLSGIHTALHPEPIAAFANLAGPFDFRHAGVLRRMTEPQWFDVDAIADAGNVAAKQMQSGFVALRPTSQIAKWVSFIDRAHDPKYREAFAALDGWASDNIPFPADAYRTYIRDLYQENFLIQKKHYVAGRRVDLGQITCPVLTITASRDHICPEPAAAALNDAVSSEDTELMVIKGGHVGAVVGSRASQTLYPKMTQWFAERLEAEPAEAQHEVQ